MEGPTTKGKESRRLKWSVTFSGVNNVFYPKEGWGKIKFPKILRIFSSKMSLGGVE